LTKDYVISNSQKRIAFDIGNVLFHFNLSPIIDLLMELNIFEDINVAYKFMDCNQQPHEIGLYNIKQSFLQIDKTLSDNILQQIQDRWMDIFYPSLPMIDIIEELIGNNHHVALLSNIGSDHAKAVLDKCKVFHKCIRHFSYEIGARKPTRLYYQSFLLQYGWPKNSLYFDDRSENIVIGNEFHQGVLFDLNNYLSDEDAAKAMRNYISLA
jgi:FMN phosphatase YigB (HAD superfamily)